MQGKDTAKLGESISLCHVVIVEVITLNQFYMIMCGKFTRIDIIIYTFR